jgi:uncharacterized protein (TIGR03067 family)
VKRTTSLAVYVLAWSMVTVGFGQDEKKDKEVVEALQGEWILTSIRFADYELRGSAEKPMKVTVDKKRMVFRPAHAVNSNWNWGTDGKSDSSVGISLSNHSEEATFEIDSAKTPAQIDLRVTVGKGDVRTRKSIYRLADDELTICVGLRFLGRPTEFKSEGLDTVLQLKRAPKK